MINVCLADSFPVVHYGIKSYFKNHPEISLVSNIASFYLVPYALRNESIDVLIIDIEIEGLKSIKDLKTIMKDFPHTKILVFTKLNEQVYSPNIIRAGIYGFVHKLSKLETLGNSIIKVNQGEVIMSESVKKNLELNSKKIKSDRLYKKLSNREIEVLRYLSDGKKNNEIAKLLELNEKTISTYKLRLLQKLNVTNLVDLVNKASTLEII